MTTPIPSRSSRRFNIVVIALIVLAAFAFKPLKLLYHESAMRSAWDATFQQGGTNTTELARFERHRDALVTAGYLERSAFEPIHIKPESQEFAALFKALNEHAIRGNGYFSMQGFEQVAKPMVIVWATPSKMFEWESIIAKHDQPRQNEEPATPAPNP